MTLFQLVMTPVLAVAGLYSVRQWFEHRSRRFAAMALVFAAGTVAVLRPELTQKLANALGIGRGADLVAYFSALALVGVSLALVQGQRKLRAEITELTRQLALRDMQQPSGVGRQRVAAVSERVAGGAGRIVVFCAHFYPHVGGVERYTQKLWSRLVQRGWDVTVVTTNTNNVAERETIEGLDVWRLPVWKVLEDRVPVLRPSALRRELVAHVTGNPPDVFVMNTRFFHTSVLAVRLAKRTQRPLIHIEHGSAHISLGRPMVDQVTKMIDRVVGSWVLHRAQRRFGVSQAVCDFMESGFGYGGGGVLYNGVDTTPHATQRDFRQELGLSEDDTLISYVGRLIEAKGALDLYRAYNDLPASSRPHLAFGGNGPLDAELRAAAEADPRMHVLGRLQPSEVHDLLAATDIFSFPSAYPEGLPTVVLEAAAAGCAVVATPMGGTGEIISHGETGMLVPPRDAGALTRTLDQLIADPRLRDDLGAAVREEARRRFDWEVIADEAEQVIQEVQTATSS